MVFSLFNIVRLNPVRPPVQSNFKNTSFLLNRKIFFVTTLVKRVFLPNPNINFFHQNLKKNQVFPPKTHKIMFFIKNSKVDFFTKSKNSCFFNKTAKSCFTKTANLCFCKLWDRVFHRNRQSIPQNHNKFFRPKPWNKVFLAKPKIGFFSSLKSQRRTI